MLVKLDIASDGVTLGTGLTRVGNFAAAILPSGIDRLRSDGADLQWRRGLPRLRLPRCGRRGRPRLYKCALAIVGQRAFFLAIAFALLSTAA
jgi:hypothetical protein